LRPTPSTKGPECIKIKLPLILFPFCKGLTGQQEESIWETGVFVGAGVTVTDGIVVDGVLDGTDVLFSSVTELQELFTIAIITRISETNFHIFICIFFF
jgi:hypothetical protein